MSDTDREAVAPDLRPPAEIWMIWNLHNEHWETYFAYGEEPTFLSYPTREQAERVMAVIQIDMDDDRWSPLLAVRAHPPSGAPIMSDTDEWPVVKRPEPPREAWGLWHDSEWFEVDDFALAGFSGGLIWFPGREIAEEAASYLTGEYRLDVPIIPVRLIPPAE